MLGWLKKLRTRSAGEEGEERALRHLLKQGLRLEARNYRVGGGPRRPAGEIDLVMRDRDGTLVFVEVRVRRDSAHGGAAASVGASKQGRLVRAAQHYLLRFATPPACRFDVVAIEGERIDWLQAAFAARDNFAMLETRLQQQFFESADLLYQAAESLTKPLATAAQTMLASVTAGSRLLVAGAGIAQADAQLFAALLAGQFEQDRPGLAAIALQPQLGQLSGMAALSRQVQSLGHPGDLLLLLDPDADPEAGALVQAAQGQDMAIIALAGPDDAQLRAALSDTDVLIRLAAPRLPRRLEMQRLVLHALCDALDAQLLGLEA